MQKLKYNPNDDYPGYSIKNVVGKGAYGEVRSAKHEASGTIVAIKKM
jgi:serine/threonine protein kinase